MAQAGQGDPFGRTDISTERSPGVESAEAEGLEVFDPTGAFEITRLHAPRLADLHGKTICEISNSIWETDRTFPLIREELKKRFPTVRIVPYQEFVGTRAQCEDLEYVARMVKEKACDAVIAGNAS
jgi:ABC-type amino acid transport substrate-binding protein